MAIEFLRNNAIKAMSDGTASLRKTGTGHADKAAAQYGANNASVIAADEVAITDSAMLLSQAAKILESHDGVDYDKVSEIKRQLENGSYKLDNEYTAERMIEFESAISSLGFC